MIRVLHVAPGNLFGGIETLLVTLARLRDLCPSMEPEFAICFDGRLKSELEAASVPVHGLGALKVRYPNTIWRARRRTAEILRRRRPDVVICHHAWTQAILGPVVRAANIPLVFWLQGQTTGRHWSERWAALTPPDLAICLSHFLTTELRTIYPEIAAHVVYNPVPPIAAFTDAARREVRAEIGTASDAVVIAQACRMEPGKGARILLDALGSIRDIDGWECWQIGGPQRAMEREYFDSLRGQAARLGIDGRVRFWGQRSDVVRLLAAADIYCQPNDTFREGLGAVFIEAMRAGLPVVTTRLGAAAEVIDETAGFLLAPGDAVALAATLAQLICDPNLRSRLSAGGRIRAEARFSPAVQLPLLYEVLMKAVRRELPADDDRRTIAE
jgi:glycosyltransferase involved in cell wall biosynthesis